MRTCERCGANAERLYHVGQEDDEGITIKKVCWDCDFDVCNGGNLFEDPALIHSDREDEAYAYDPINNPRLT